jgi:hypothetical protein
MKYLARIGCQLGFSAMLALPAWLAAQNGSPQPRTNIETPHQILVTGCLKRGNQPGTFVISDQNGTTWELVSDTSGIDLAQHIFHSVSIGGKEVPVPQKAGGAPEHELRVVSLRVLSRSCTR